MDLRIGHGYDIHRLQEHGRLMLGGVRVADNLSPIAHSDGDVVLHALVDALLGALGQGDIGQMFPNTDPQWKGAASQIFVQAVMHEVRTRGWTVKNADVTILAERPRLQKFKPAMEDVIEEMIAAPVNVKAGTNEQCDAIGQGQAIAAHVVVLLVKP